jgi:hypothetical protein
MYLHGAAGIGLGATFKYLRSDAGIGLGTTFKYLHRTTSAAAGNGLGKKLKCRVNQKAGAGNNWATGLYARAGRELF